MNPCRVGNGGCSHLCTGDKGRPICRCHLGYALGIDERSCEGLKISDFNICMILEICSYFKKNQFCESK